MTAVYRMTDDGWTGDQAFKEMKHYKFGAGFFHPEFKAFVLAYHPSPKTAPAHPPTVLATAVNGVPSAAASSR
jgi:hypothetical protein